MQRPMLGFGFFTFHDVKNMSPVLFETSLGHPVIYVEWTTTQHTFTYQQTYFSSPLFFESVIKTQAHLKKINQFVQLVLPFLSWFKE